MYFLDSNTVFYSLDQAAPDWKRQRALQLWGPDAWISVQVLAEVCNVFQKKRNRSAEDCLQVVRMLRTAFQVVVLTPQLIESALEIKGRFRTSQYDAQIVAAALEAGCDTVYSEDMHHGLRIDGGLTILNPFA